MYQITVSTRINASARRCFDLARDVETHVGSAEGTGERIVAGRMTGLLELGEELTFEGRHFGLKQQLSSRVTALEPYSFFQDRMTEGAFRFLEHDHKFIERNAGETEMVDVITFKAPFGPIGWLAERWVLAPHLRRFLRTRGVFLKQFAESSSAM